jgi:hypothetical protein
MATISLARANRFLASVADPVPASVLLKPSSTPLLCGLPSNVRVPIRDTRVMPYAVVVWSWGLVIPDVPDSLDDILEVGTTFTIKGVKTRTWLFPESDSYALHREPAKPDKHYYVYGSSLFVPRCPDLTESLYRAEKAFSDRT